MNKVLSYVATWKFWKELIIMTLGMLVAAIAVNYFMVPGQLILGSISGLSVVLSKLSLSMFGVELKVSLVVLIINIFLLILAWIFIGKEFGAKTVYTALILGPMIEFWERVLPASTFIAEGSNSVMGDHWLDLVCFVLILSFSQSLLFGINASTGGLDILGKIVNKYMHLDLGASISVAGAIICCTAFAINPFNLVVLGLIGTWINGLVIDYFTASFNRRKRICIISHEHEKLRQFIIEKLHRGCSLYENIGGYTGEKQIEIQALLTKDEFAAIMAFIKDENVNCFVTAGNVSEVYGTWNDHKHNKSTHISL